MGLNSIQTTGRAKRDKDDIILDTQPIKGHITVYKGFVLYDPNNEIFLSTMNKQLYWADNTRLLFLNAEARCNSNIFEKVMRIVDIPSKFQLVPCKMYRRKINDTQYESYADLVFANSFNLEGFLQDRGYSITSHIFEHTVAKAMAAEILKEIDSEIIANITKQHGVDVEAEVARMVTKEYEDGKNK